MQPVKGCRKDSSRKGCPRYRDAAPASRDPVVPRSVDHVQLSFNFNDNVKTWHSCYCPCLPLSTAFCLPSPSYLMSCLVSGTEFTLLPHVCSGLFRISFRRDCCSIPMHMVLLLLSLTLHTYGWDAGLATTARLPNARCRLLVSNSSASTKQQMDLVVQA